MDKSALRRPLFCYRPDKARVAGGRRLERMMSYGGGGGGAGGGGAAGAGPGEPRPLAGEALRRAVNLALRQTKKLRKYELEKVWPTRGDCLILLRILV